MNKRIWWVSIKGIGAILTDSPWNFRDVMDEENEVMMCAVHKEHYHFLKDELLDRLLCPHEAMEFRDYVDAEVEKALRLESIQ